MYFFVASNFSKVFAGAKYFSLGNFLSLSGVNTLSNTQRGEWLSFSKAVLKSSGSSIPPMNV